MHGQFFPVVSVTTIQVCAPPVFFGDFRVPSRDMSGTQGGQKKSVLLGLEWRAGVPVLEPASSARAASALNCCAVSLAPRQGFVLFCFYYFVFGCTQCSLIYIEVVAGKSLLPEREGLSRIASTLEERMLRPSAGM